VATRLIRAWSAQESTHPMRGNRSTNQGLREMADENRRRGRPGYGCPVVDHRGLASGFDWTDCPKLNPGHPEGFLAKRPIFLARTCSGAEKSMGMDFAHPLPRWVCLGARPPQAPISGPKTGVMAT